MSVKHANAAGWSEAVGGGTVVDAQRPFRVADQSKDALTTDPVELAAAFCADDRLAAEVLTNHLLPMVTRLVRRLSAWSPDADDLVQDVLVAALAKRKKFRREARLETWITRIAINQCRAAHRKRWLRTRLFSGWAEQRPGAMASTVSLTPMDELLADERAERVRAAVAQLPALSREALVLRYFEGMSVAEAAETVGVRRGTLEVRLSRARQELRKVLGEK
jgi:RNA polymerase sigma-70 factor, ECF subfamily